MATLLRRGLEVLGLVEKEHLTKKWDALLEMVSEEEDDETFASNGPYVRMKWHEERRARR